MIVFHKKNEQVAHLPITQLLKRISNEDITLTNQAIAVDTKIFYKYSIWVIILSPYPPNKIVRPAIDRSYYKVKPE